MDPLTVRPARPDDLDAIATLTRAMRHRLAGWSPAWWAVAEGADELHPLWLRHLIATDGPLARVAIEPTGTVVGCAISVPQGAAWFVDDLAATSPAALDALLGAVAERPAVTCVATLDDVGTAAAARAGLRLASSYWIGPGGPARTSGAAEEPDAAGAPEASAREVPTHTFGPALAHGGHGRLLIDGADGSRAWGSDPLPPPPVYGAGGTVAVLTAVEGPDRSAALAAARGLAGGRGDVLVCLVVAAADADLAAVAQTAGLTRTVDVWAWPA